MSNIAASATSWKAVAVPALAGYGAVQAKGPEDVIRVILGGHLVTGTFARRRQLERR